MPANLLPMILPTLLSGGFNLFMDSRERKRQRQNESIQRERTKKTMIEDQFMRQISSGFRNNTLLDSIRRL